MGQKTHPKGFRLGVVTDWDSIWYAEDSYPKLILEDMKIRDYLYRQAKRAGISNIVIKRRAEQIEVVMMAARPGILIGKGGEEIQVLRQDLRSLLQKRVNLNVVEEKNVETNGKFLAEMVANQLERRIAYRRAMKRAIQQAIKQGAEGIKILVGGRLGGAEMSRDVWLREGRVPLQTLRANLDFATTEALTTYGQIGIKVWIYKVEAKHEIEEKAEATEGVYVSE